MGKKGLVVFILGLHQVCFRTKVVGMVDSDLGDIESG